MIGWFVADPEPDGLNNLVRVVFQPAGPYPGYPFAPADMVGIRYDMVFVTW